jgi:hypothetical protein
MQGRKWVRAPVSPDGVKGGGMYGKYAKTTRDSPCRSKGKLGVKTEGKKSDRILRKEQSEPGIYCFTRVARERKQFAEKPWYKAECRKPT